MKEQRVMWFDNHCHFTSMKADTKDALDAAHTMGVSRFLTVGCTVADSQAAIGIAGRYDNVWATAGVHPHSAKGGIEGLAELLGQPGVVAVGECGLDYYYDNSPRPEQRDVFAAQVRLAHNHDLALVIHSRQAWDDTFDVLSSEGVPNKTVFHCFTGGPAELDRCLQIGAYVSFSGIVTYPSAPELQQAAQLVPLDRVMVETDSPYLAPVPVRGKPNQPANVRHVGEFIASLRDLPVEMVAEVTTATTMDFYGITEKAGSLGH